MPPKNTTSPLWLATSVVVFANLVLVAAKVPTISNSTVGSIVLIPTIPPAEPENIAAYEFGAPSYSITIS